MATTRRRSSDPGPVRPARRAGRPSRLTDELERELCRFRRAGASLHDAALLVGVSPSAVHTWLAEGRRLDGRPRLQAFAAAMEATRNEETLSLYSDLQHAIRSGKWRAAAYFLERRFPEDWKLQWRYDKYGRPRPPRRAEERAASGAGGVPGGLPARLTPEVEAKLSLAFRLGAFPAVAVAYAGISRSTLYRWRAAARHPDAHPQLKQLDAELRRAEAQAALEAVLTIRRAADGRWRAAAWLLERLEPEAFGPVDRFGRRPTNPTPDWEPEVRLAPRSQQS